MHWKLLYKSKYKGVEFLPQNLNTFLYIFQTMNSFKLNNQSLKYQRFVLSGCKDKGIRKFQFVGKTQILCLNFALIVGFPFLMFVLTLTIQLRTSRTTSSETHPPPPRLIFFLLKFFLYSYLDYVLRIWIMLYVSENYSVFSFEFFYLVLKKFYVFFLWFILRLLNKGTEFLSQTQIV